MALSILTTSLLLLSGTASANIQSQPPKQHVLPPLRSHVNDCLPGPVKHDLLPSCETAFVSNETLKSGQEKPWTHTPFCLDTKAGTPYCVFTASKFQGPKRGISIIAPLSNNASSSLAQIEKLILASPKAKDDFITVGEDLEDPPYALRTIDGKGFGLIATRKIPKGSIFMTDYATLMADKDFAANLRMEQGRLLLSEAVVRLPYPDRVLKLARSSTRPGDVPAAEDVMKTNSFSVEAVGLSPLHLSRFANMNQVPSLDSMPLRSPRPSLLSGIFFREKRLQSAVSYTLLSVTRFVKTVAYLNQDTAFNLQSKIRLPRLKKLWGFDCSCNLCAGPPELLAASDARRQKVDDLGPEIVELVEEGKFDEAVKLNKEMIQALTEEEILPHMGDYYEIMGRLYQAWGKKKEAVEWFEKALDEVEGFKADGADDLKRIIKALKAEKKQA
ncbi:uncharacterized protein PODANS_3_10350 [Podospora anserina S mat+]|uniref:Podospora anserina S mat+ genomic DNA chromosome 3, supercontig 2 n=1 Tax=Podospora anserina (strain S / ATCC MYA-4624 / DSM 980 / FGSC 10383) TaxID=515849 RepID=B2B1J9_PODAN|nr:uncharacterized protein PODANS_3_10350 [Podospora anserina S mat+]CAP70984.1 unnamed protein product [Podospora anserina S mat+]CDP27579.1 Putative protein of unknown function [Podospora anserina S mat+]